MKKKLLAASTIALAMLSFIIPASAFAQRLQQLKGHMQDYARHLTPKSNVSDTASLDLIIGLPLRNQDSVDHLLELLYDPSSPDFHKYLTPERYSSLFCPSTGDYQALINWARKKQLSIVSTAPNRKFIHVKASAATIQQAFHLQLQQYQHPTENRLFYAPSGEPAMDLEIPVSYISGLDNYYTPGRHPNTLLRKSGSSSDTTIHSAGGSAPGGYYSGNDFRAAYAPDVSYTGKGQAVGILELNGYNTSDINAYEKEYGILAVPIQNVYLDGYTGASPNAESAADIELVISMAPGISKAIVYGAPYNTAGVHDILNEMANPTKGEPLPNQITTSYYFFYDQNVYDALKQLAIQGQALFVASGDFGAYNEKTGAGAFPPADHPLVTSVGGTVLQTSAPGGAWQSETTVSFSGGGYSPWGTDPQFAIPSWQKGMDMSMNKGSATIRNSPDVSMVATDILIYQNGSWSGFAGTSASAPLWAGFAALANQAAQSKGLSKIGFLNPALYAVGKSNSYNSSFHDITTGNNFNSYNPASYAAVAGFDLCTGWGSPHGMGLINALVNYGTNSHTAAVAAGDPMGIADNWGRFHILYKDANSQISDINYSSAASWKYNNLSEGVTTAHAAAANGNPFSVTDPFGTFHVLYRDINNHISDIYYQNNNGWKYTALGGASAAMANGNPYALVDKWGSFHVLYRDVNNRVSDLYFRSNWNYVSLSDQVNAPAANGDIHAIMDKWGTFHVLYRDAANHISDLYYQGSGWKYVNLSAGSGAPAAAGDPTPVMDSWGTMHVLYRDINNHVSDIYYQGSGWKYVDHNSTPGATAVNGDPMATTDKWGTFHIVYRDAGNQLADIYFQGGGWKFVNLSGGPGAPPAGGDPYALMDQFGTFHVLYKDNRSQVADVYYQGSRWKYSNASSR